MELNLFLDLIRIIDLGLDRPLLLAAKLSVITLIHTGTRGVVIVLHLLENTARDHSPQESEVDNPLAHSLLPTTITELTLANDRRIVMEKMASSQLTSSLTLSD